MSETKATENWFARRAEAEAKKDTLSYSERVGNIVGVVIGLLFVLYFVAHQTGLTGFLLQNSASWRHSCFMGL